MTTPTDSVGSAVVLWCFLPTLLVFMTLLMSQLLTRGTSLLMHTLMLMQRGAVPLLPKENGPLLVFLLCKVMQLYEVWGVMELFCNIFSTPVCLMQCDVMGNKG